MVPTVFGAAVRIVVPLIVPLIPFAKYPWAVVLPLMIAQAILVLLGLLELRRRLTGTASRWVAIGAGMQALTVTLLIAPLIASGLAGARGGWWLAMAPTGTLVVAVGFAVVLGFAARAWRSVLGPLVIVTALLGHAQQFVLPALVDAFGSQALIGGYVLLVLLVHTAGMLAIYRRLGAATQSSPDPARAERGARRMVIAQWLGIGIAVALVVAAIVVDLLGEPSLEDLAAVISMLSTIAVSAIAVSGLLGLARADLAGLSARALCTAAVGVLWGGLARNSSIFVAYRAWSSGSTVDASMIGGIAVSLLCVVAGAAAIRGYVARRGDRQASHAMARRLALIVALDIAYLACFAIARPTSGSEVVTMVALTLALQSGAALALASMFARLGRRVAIAAAVDAF